MVHFSGKPRRSGPCRSITGAKPSTTSRSCGRNGCRPWRELRDESTSHFYRDGQGKGNCPLPLHPIPKNKTWSFTQKSGHTRIGIFLRSDFSEFLTSYLTHAQIEAELRSELSMT